MAPTPARLPLKKGISLRWLPFFFIFLQSVLYGFGDPISKAAYEVLPVFSLLTVRYGIAFLFLLLIFNKRIVQSIKTASLKDWLLPSLCIGGSYVLSNIALELTAATSVAFLRSLSTIMTPLLALAVYRKKFGKKHVPVQLLVIVGLYLLLAGSLIFGEKALDRVDPVTLTALQALTSFVLALVCAFAFDGGMQLGAATPTVWGIIVYMAIGCTVAGYLLQNAALGHISSRTVALLQCICPVLTALFSRILLDERLSLLGMVGAVIILLCVAAETLMKDDE